MHQPTVGLVCYARLIFYLVIYAIVPRTGHTITLEGKVWARLPALVATPLGPIYMCTVPKLMPTM